MGLRSSARPAAQLSLDLRSPGFLLACHHACWHRRGASRRVMALVLERCDALERRHRRRLNLQTTLAGVGMKLDESWRPFKLRSTSSSRHAEQQRTTRAAPLDDVDRITSTVGSAHLEPSATRE